MADSDSGRRVAVTGASGSLGRHVLRELSADPRIERIVALDRAPLPQSFPKVEFRACDVRDAAIARHFEACHAVLHLAFIVERGSRDARETAEINLGGTRNVCEAAAAAGVPQLVYASSIAAYGFDPANDGVFLSEDAPIRGAPGFYYSEHKAENERWLDGFEAAHPEIRVARMRPSIFLGESSPRARALRGRFHVYFSGPAPRAQITHEHDVAAAFVLALDRGARGAFNVASDEPLSMREMGRALGKRSVALPRALLGLHRLAYRLKWVDVDPIWLEVGAAYSLLAANEKVKKELGWKPRFPTTADALRQIAGRPNGRASRTARAFFGPMVRMTRLLGALPAGRDAPAEMGGLRGCIDLVLTGEEPSQWHFSLRDGRMGVYPGRAAESRATITMRDRTFTDLLAGRLEPSTAQMTGKIRVRGDGEMAFLVGGLVGTFRNLGEAQGLRGWPARLYARHVLRGVESPPPTPRLDRDSRSPR